MGSLIAVVQTQLCILQVLTAVFEYLALLRQKGPVKRIYEEIQTIESNEFRWQEQVMIDEPWTITSFRSLPVFLPHFLCISRPL